MAFQLRIGISPEPLVGSLRMELKCDYFSDTIDLKERGQIIVRSYNAPLNKLFQLNLGFYVDQDRVGVAIHGVEADDALSIVVSPHSKAKTQAPGALYLGAVWHATPQRSEPCTVICDDGTEGDCCVTCQKGRSVTKICC
jgi:hypothetical protein